MKLKKPYSQYIGKVIIYDGLHKHLILKFLGKKKDRDFLLFDTICISYAGNARLEVDRDAGFLEDSADQDLTDLSDKEKHWIIKFAFKGKDEILVANL